VIKVHIGNARHSWLESPKRQEVAAQEVDNGFFRGTGNTSLESHQASAHWEQEKT